MKWRVIFAAVVWFSGAGVVQADPQQEAERKTLLGLVSRLPKIDTNSVACPPFDARFEWQATNGHYRADFRFRRPDRLEATMTDRADGTPCALYRDKRIMFFDPVAPSFVVADGYMLDFALCQGENGKVAYGTSLGFGKEHVQRVQIDLPFIMQVPAGVLANDGSTDSVIRLRQVRGEWHDEFELRVAEPPVCVLKAFEGDRTEPQMMITLTLYPADSTPLFTSPDLDQLAKLVPVSGPTRQGPLDGVLGFAAGMKTIAHGYYAIYSHIAFLQPEIREGLKIPGFSTPDWDVVRRHKQELSPKLRDLCGLPAPTVDKDDTPLTPMLAADEAAAVK